MSDTKWCVRSRDKKADFDETRVQNYVHSIFQGTTVRSR